MIAVHRGAGLMTPEEACRRAEDYRVFHRIRLDAALRYLAAAGDDTRDFWRARVARTKSLLAVHAHSLGGRPEEAIPEVETYYAETEGPRP